MIAHTLKIFDTKAGEFPTINGEVVGVVGFGVTAVFYTDSRKGFYLIGTGEKEMNIRYWFKLIMPDDIEIVWPDNEHKE